MPLNTEGFGLTGLEALSAWCPVFISKNWHFGESLGSVWLGSFFVIDSEDPSAWAATIKGIWNRDRKSQLDKVKAVQGSYCKRYSWSKQWKALFESMVIKLWTTFRFYHLVDLNLNFEDMCSTIQNALLWTKVIMQRHVKKCNYTIPVKVGSTLCNVFTTMWGLLQFLEGFGWDSFCYTFDKWASEIRLIICLTSFTHDCYLDHLKFSLFYKNFL